MTSEQVKQRIEEVYEQLDDMTPYTNHPPVEAALITGACDIVKAQIIAEAINNTNNTNNTNDTNDMSLKDLLPNDEDIDEDEGLLDLTEQDDKYTSYSH